jgi:uncharacterized protein (TIGR04168 family)
VLFVGDLCRFVSARETLALAGRLAQLTTPAIFIPGNHDVANAIQFVAELRGRRWLARLAGGGHVRHHRRLAAALAPVELAGYSLHPIVRDGVALDVIAGRPYAMGGSQLSFAPFLRRAYGVGSLGESTARLKELVDASTAPRLLFLAHNGPCGLGNGPADIWGCDFDPARGDFGDRDLAAGIAYARDRGKEVVAVIAGHMHRLSKSGRHRTWHVERDGTHFVNAAQVPRHVNTRGRTVRHHVHLALGSESVSVQDRWL